MVYIKKLVMSGFKSFAKKTELLLNPEINIVIGPNGSGKSNVTDALCFVLGRMSVKSMRAAKTSNLIFAGTKTIGPSKEAMVEITFSNEDQIFSFEENEIIIKRILRKNGQSIYKINGRTTTRQEILSVLAQAGIDPNGFNIILQNEIQNFARGSPEDKRKLIEEVAGISIYEFRKEKSLKELEKTIEKLKEVESILRERGLLLNNLEKEKEIAMKKKSLEANLKKYKASSIFIDLEEKKKEGEKIVKNILEKNEEIEKYKKEILTLKTNNENLEEKIESLNLEIQKQTGIEQEQLNKEISDLRSEIAVLKVKIESHEKKIKEIEKQKQDYEKIIINNRESIDSLKKESPTIALIQKELEKKKKELNELEDKRKKYYYTKSELRAISQRIEDRKKILQNYNNESEFLVKQINSLIGELYDRGTDLKIVEKLKETLAIEKAELDDLNIKEREIDKKINTSEYEIKKQKEVVEKIEKIDVCPLCKSKITEEHIHSINDEILPIVTKLQEEINLEKKELKELREKRTKLKESIENKTLEIQKRQSDLIKLNNIQDKEEQVKILHKKVTESMKELENLETKKEKLEDDFEEDSTIEEKYETLQIEVQEISIRNKENLDSEIQFKQKEIERANISINKLLRDGEYLQEEILIAANNLEEKEKELAIRKKQEEDLRNKAKKYIDERNLLHQKQREIDREISVEKNKQHFVEEQINNFKVEKARVDAQIQNFETDILEYPDVEIIKSNKNKLLEKIDKVEIALSKIGAVNMRALEVYKEVKQEYELVKEKSETISNEKEKILSIITKIDIEKRKVFIKTVQELNEKFNRNFSQISTKGQVYLEIQNKKDPFSEGVDIILKTGHGKYFDVKSLSGGEMTMVALSLIFAIQELKPYCFYILDEIDAALDKRNAARLAGFLKKYAQKGQYIVISHNDEIITNAKILFGVSMHEGISKLTVLKI